MFCLFYDAKAMAVRSLNGSGRSPLNASLDDICRELGITDQANAAIPRTSVHAVTIPGAAAGWVDTIEHFGSGALTLKQILAPAIELAEEGFPVGEISAYLVRLRVCGVLYPWLLTTAQWEISEEELKSSPNGSELLQPDPSAPGGFRAPHEGEIFKNPQLANTFRLLAEQGLDGFYSGPVAEAIIHATQIRGGHHALQDLKDHAAKRSEVGIPMSIKLGSADDSVAGNTVNGVELWEHPPNGQGIVALIALAIIQELERTQRIPPLDQMGHNSVA